ncbi:MAG: hypothetical protein NZ519_08325 [Bacteroidia bacterium]|nr:hypothetical protein [Bacteroidia bacterium]MCS7028756.1 hypothetical protein [Bacteroidia bacterium]
MAKYTIQQLNKLGKEEVAKIAATLNISVSTKSTKKQIIESIINCQKVPSLFTDKLPSQSNNSNIDLSRVSKDKLDSLYISSFVIQINKSNLLDYFGSALIYPVNYETRELARSQRTKDIQHFSPNHLLISDGFTDEPNEQQVLIEVALTDFDKQNLERLHEVVYLLPYPLPISRVNKIYFASKESQENSIASASTFQDAFLPIHLFDIWTESIENRTNIVREIQVSQITANKNLKTESQDKFNRILGMLAFMKNAEIYYANETYELAIYSDKYLKLLREINPFFDKPEIGVLDKGSLSFYSTLIKPKNSPNDTLQKIVNAIYANETFRKDILKQILGTPTEEVQNAFKLLVGDKTLEALQAIDQLKPAALELILLAFLFRFRDKEGSDKYALKEQLPELINRKTLKTIRTHNRASIVLAVLGLYYGYRSLPKDEEINLNDSYFASFSKNGKFNIKYKLDNLLDRITIESVYQFCFWDNQKNDFGFLKDDKTVVKYDLNEGYSDEKTFSIVENYPIIRISKCHSEPNKRLKNQTMGMWAKFISFINVLKKNGLAQGDVTFDTTEFNVWLHNNPSSDLANLLAEFQTLQQNEPTNNQG